MESEKLYRVFLSIFIISLLQFRLMAQEVDTSFFAASENNIYALGYHKTYLNLELENSLASLDTNIDQLSKRIDSLSRLIYLLDLKIKKLQLSKLKSQSSNSQYEDVTAKRIQILALSTEIEESRTRIESRTDTWKKLWKYLKNKNDSISVISKQKILEGMASTTKQLDIQLKYLTN